MNLFLSHKLNIINKLKQVRRSLLLTGLFFIITLTGYGQLTVDFLASSTSICSGSTVTFTDNSTGASDFAVYKWDFGAGASPSVATGIGPHIVNYSKSGTSSVNLTVTDTSSVIKTKVGYVIVIGNPASPVVVVSDNCDTTSTLSTSAEGILLWSNGEMSSSIIVKTAGVYKVTTTINGCTSLPGSGTASPRMSPSSPVTSTDCTLGFGKAVINISAPVGSGYEYRLDAGAYNSGTSFSRVTNGSHMITVRNASGCTTSGGFFEVSCGCVDAASVTLSSTSGSTCDKIPVTVSGNSFGGVADWVTITENGSGSVSPVTTTSSPFAFTYTPKAADAGKTVIITVTTNNPSGTPCVAAKETYSLAVHASPSAPVITKIIQPTCSLRTATVEIDGLPLDGTWSLITSPGEITTVGNGAGTTISDMLPGTYRFTVKSEAGCISEPSAITVIQNQPVTPTPPQIGTVTHPTCTVSTGSALLTGLPSTGNWTLTRNPGGVTTTGSGTSKLVTDLPAGTFTFTVINSAGCKSVPSNILTINSQPANPVIPIVGTISPPTCLLSTGSVELKGLPVTGQWILTRYPGTVASAGSGASVIISGLPSGMYNFTLTNETGCISAPSANIVIPAQPSIPPAPVIGTITFPSCTEPTGSVVLNGLPASGTWNLTRNPDGTVTAGTGTTITISGLTVGKYTFSVTSAAGCKSTLSGEVTIPVQPGIPSLVITNPPVLCSTGKADLTSASITAGSTTGLTLSYWTNASGTTPYLTPAATTEGTYYIKGTTISGCFDIKPVTVTVSQLLKAYAGPDQNLEFQSGTTLDAELDNVSETGIWSVISGTADFSDKNFAKTPVTGLSQGINEFLWTITNGVCPPSSDTVRITVNELKIRTLMTPNMDGRNDYFIINGLNALGRTELVIYDRRGAQVYKNPDYDNLWNGVNYNDDPLPDDTYFFVIKPENGKPVSGFVVIRR